jgi:hypothetical protein
MEEFLWLNNVEILEIQQEKLLDATYFLLRLTIYIFGPLKRFTV